MLSTRFSRSASTKLSRSYSGATQANTNTAKTVSADNSNRLFLAVGLLGIGTAGYYYLNDTNSGREDLHALEAEYRREKAKLENRGNEMRGEIGSVAERAKTVFKEDVEMAQKKGKEITDQGAGWFGSSNRVAEAKVAVKSDTNNLLNKAEDKYQAGAKEIQGKLDSSKQAFHETAEDLAEVVSDTSKSVKATGRSWFSFGSRKAEEASTKVDQAREGVRDGMRDGKEEVKDRLISMEKKVEEGAKKAQEKTSRL